METFETHLGSSPVDPNALDYHRALLLPDCSYLGVSKSLGAHNLVALSASNHVIRPTVTSSENVNSSISAYYQVCPRSDHTLRMQLALFAQIAKVPIFSTLRTKEQLGYIVSSGIWSFSGLSGFRVQVQSERTAEYLEERIEALWERFTVYLEDMTSEDFEKQKGSLVNTKLEQPKNLGQE